jgi:N-acetylglucosaminyl-diphospho-decaprenol L-rhamnosyltransferase
MSALELAVVIVNWNTVELLRQCLTSVYLNGSPAFEVCVVDNASADGSADMVAAQFPQARLIRNSVNVGFSRATNAGLRSLGFGLGFGGSKSVPRYGLLLNPDTVVPAGAFARAADFFAAHPGAGALGPKLLRPDGSLDPACRRSFPTPASSLYRFSGLARLFPKSRRFGRYNMTWCDPDELTEVDCVNGAFMMVRGSVIEQVGLLDEEFFFGGEDLDWAYRIRAAGWKIYYYPAIEVRHEKQAAFRKNPDAAYEFERAMWLFYRKHYRLQTPRWLDGLVRAGLVMRGGLRLAREMRAADAAGASSVKGAL